MLAPSTTADVAPTYWDKHPTQKQVALAAANTLPGLGALAGGIAASPTVMSGFGPAVGAGLGAGIGRGARDLITEGAGLEDVSTPSDKAARIGGDTAMTAATSAVLPGIVAFAKTPLRSTGELIQEVYPNFARTKAIDDALAWMTKAPSAPIAPPRVNVENLGGSLKPGTTPRFKPPIQSGIDEGLASLRSGAQASELPLSNPAGGGFTVPANVQSTRPLVTYSPRAKEVLAVMSKPNSEEETLFQYLSKKLVLSESEARTLDRLKEVMGRRASNMGTSYAARGAR